LTTLEIGILRVGVRPLTIASAILVGSTTEVAGFVGLVTGNVAGSTKGIGWVERPPKEADEPLTPIPVVLVVLGITAFS
jgi:hypothetical protein